MAKKKDAPRRSLLRRFLGALFTLLVFAGAGAGGWYWLDYRGFADSPLTLGAEERTLDIPSGTAFVGIVRRVREAGYSTAPELYWRALGWEMKVASSLHAGEYALSPGLTPRALLRKMAAGEVVQHRFTIVEGWSFRQLRVALAADTGLVGSVAALNDAEIMEKLGAKDQAAEGRFLPETYSYTRGASDLDILRQAHGAMDKALSAAWVQRSTPTPLKSADEALTLASIVEKETGRAEERAKIAQVFLRRLDLGMRLQTDPTVIYGMGANYDGNIRKRDLEADTPYNTYTRAGLPPTPIALPGKAAIEAALHPAPGQALYFVARGDGSHEFSDSLDAHNRAVAKYQLHR
jgi:UPF0755 protein